MPWPIAKSPQPVAEIAVTHSAFEPKKVSESQSVEGDVEGRSKAAIEIASSFHRGFPFPSDVRNHRSASWELSHLKSWARRYSDCACKSITRPKCDIHSPQSAEKGIGAVRLQSFFCSTVAASAYLR